MSRGIVWFRADLRLESNPAWSAATTAHDRVTALFVVDPRPMASAGRARRDLLAAHLAALDRRLTQASGRLRVERGDPAVVVPRVAGEIGADAVHWNAGVTPYASRRDAAVASEVPAVVHHGGFVHPVGSVLTGAGSPYLVFTPFYRRWAARSLPVRPVVGDGSPDGDPGIGVPEGGPPVMEPGEQGARGRLESFVERIARYGEERDRPDLDATSRLSADLRFGTIDPVEVAAAGDAGGQGGETFVRQLAWREFCAQLMAAHPDMADAPLRSEYGAMEWRDDPEGLDRWRRGATGFPIVDAGMRQLAAEGWMHGRVRMITASFLVKDLLIDWRLGERHFRRLLVDGEPAQNAANWQWVAGTGADAAPYFRVFNPIAQGRRFDPEGDYVRRWVPELAGIEGPAVHAPWELEGDTGYPPPMVDHAEARLAAIAAYERARSLSGGGPRSPDA